MKFVEYSMKIKKIDELIRLENTGTPQEFAKLLSISERTLRRLIEDLRKNNNTIRYSRNLKSYKIEN